MVHGSVFSTESVADRPFRQRHGGEIAVEVGEDGGGGGGFFRPGMLYECSLLVCRRFDFCSILSGGGIAAI